MGIWGVYLGGGHLGDMSGVGVSPEGEYPRVSMSRGWVSRGWVCPRGVGMSKEGGYPGRMGYIGGGYSWDLRDYGYS